MAPVYYTRDHLLLAYTKLFEMVFLIFFSRQQWSGNWGFWFLAKVHWCRIQQGLSGWEILKLVFRISAQTHADLYHITVNSSQSNILYLFFDSIWTLTKTIKTFILLICIYIYYTWNISLLIVQLYITFLGHRRISNAWVKLFFKIVFLIITF